MFDNTKGGNPKAVQEILAKEEYSLTIYYKNSVVVSAELNKINSPKDFNVEVADYLDEEAQKKILGEVHDQVRAFAVYVNDEEFTEYVNDWLLPLMTRKAVDDPMEAIKFGIKSVFFLNSGAVRRAVGASILEKLKNLFNR